MFSCILQLRLYFVQMILRLYGLYVCPVGESNHTFDIQICNYFKPKTNKSNVNIVFVNRDFVFINPVLTMTNSNNIEIQPH